MVRKKFPVTSLLLILLCAAFLVRCDKIAQEPYVRANDTATYANLNLSASPPEVPFPAAQFLYNFATGKVNLPLPAPTHPDYPMTRGLNTLDGFSTYPLVTAGQLPVTVGIYANMKNAMGQAGTVKNTGGMVTSGVKLYNLSSGAPVEVSSMGLFSNGRVAVMPTGGPLEQSTEYAVVFDDKLLGDDGKPVQPQAHFDMFFSPTPLCDASGNGLWTILACTHPTSGEHLTGVELATCQGRNKQLEGLRQLFQGMHTKLGGKCEQGACSLAWSFKTQSITATLEALRSGVLPQVPTNLVAGTIPSTSCPLNNCGGAFVGAATIAEIFTHPNPAGGAAVVWPHAQVGKVVTGCFLSPQLIGDDPSTAMVEGTFMPNPAGGVFVKPHMLAYTLFLPSSAAPAGGYPVVIWQHGLGWWRGDSMPVVNTLTSAGFAVIAIDLPFHGTRTGYTPFSPADVTPVTTCPAETTTAALNRLKHTMPGTGSGAKFLDFATLNMFGARDNVRQGALDLLQLVRAIKGTTWANMGLAIDNSKVYFGAHSMGAIVGSLFVAVADQDKTLAGAVLSAPAGGFMTVLHNSTEDMGGGKTMRDNVLASLSASSGATVTPSSEAYLRLLTIGQWIFDPADPINYGKYINASPLAGCAAKKVFLMMGKGDIYIPNQTTMALGQTLGAGACQKTYDDAGANVTHGYLFDLHKQYGQKAQADIATFLTKVKNGDADVCP